MDENTAHNPPSGAENGAVAAVGRTLSGVGVVLAVLVVVVASPVIALVTKLGDVALEVRDAFVRPRPFTGARHGMPFLDPAPPPRPASPDPPDGE
ncbi:MAG: hypothetical protein AB1416_09400 [Actinomycetota bacterium]